MSTLIGPSGLVDVIHLVTCSNSRKRLACAVHVLACIVPAAAPAQSILESVLSRLEIGQETLLPLLAMNTAINTGWIKTETTVATASDDALVAIIYGDYYDPVNSVWGTQEWGIYKSDLGTTLPAVDTWFLEDIHVEADGTIWAQDTDAYTDTFTVYDATGALFGGNGLLIDTGIGAALDILPNNAAVYTDGSEQYILSSSSAVAIDALELSYDDVYRDFRIDASVTNRIDSSVQTAIATVGEASSLELVATQIDLGAISTTGLGAVNTGAITLGVNSSVDDAVGRSTRALSGRVNAIGTTFGEMALIWNEAYNDISVDASVTNVANQVNLTIRSVSTTALGAVNTGQIVSGVNAAVLGIVGRSGQ